MPIKIKELEQLIKREKTIEVRAGKWWLEW